MAPGAADAQIGPGDPGDLDQLSQCLIQAPSNHPYFLLLQGYQDAQVSAVLTWSSLCPMSLESNKLQLPEFLRLSVLRYSGRCGPARFQSSKKRGGG